VALWQEPNGLSSEGQNRALPTVLRRQA